MPALSRLPIKTLLSQLNRRDYEESKGAGDGESKGPVAMKALSITPPNHPPTPLTDRGDLSAIPIAEIPIPAPTFIYNDYSHARLVCTQSNTFPGGHNSIAREDGRAPQAEEQPGLGRPEPGVIRQFPEDRNFAPPGSRNALALY
ncbi:hypothetical protein C7212DRAFT_362391 [Tuber magnatum]|uniref:Uncharacterized protein n=1 Tax=Tuber magnatum TaxID=42249 RepID=A0A317SU94_9PEZI|nr:hypothetical protein C7212DRAFT_362391 [Tuber magnatum]